MGRAAQVYARALFETLEEEEKNGAIPVQTVTEQLDLIERALRLSRDLHVALLGPGTSSKEKMAIIEKLAERYSFHPVLTRFLNLLAKKGRTPLLNQLKRALEEVRVQSEGGIVGEVISADPIEPKEIELLTEEFKTKLRRPVEFRVSTDASLLAGIKITVNGVTYDGTLQSQLKRLREGFVYGTGMVH